LDETLLQKSTDTEEADLFPVLDDPAIKAASLGTKPHEDDRVLNAFNLAVTASIADIKWREENQGLGLDAPFEEDRDPLGAEGLNTYWGTGISTPNDYSARPTDQYPANSLPVPLHSRCCPSKRFHRGSNNIGHDSRPTSMGHSVNHQQKIACGPTGSCHADSRM